MKKEQTMKTLCKGFIKHEIINNELVETLYAKLPDGRVFHTGKLKTPNFSFDATGRVWTYAPGMDTKALEFCGNYEIPASIKR